MPGRAQLQDNNSLCADFICNFLQNVHFQHKFLPVVTICVWLAGDEAWPLERENVDIGLQQLGSAHWPVVTAVS